MLAPGGTALRAGDGNRTRIASLEGWNSAIELRPQEPKHNRAHTLRPMRVRFTLVDVFTDVPFAGNQLCVVPEPPVDLDRVTMQVLAREIGFSETTYVTAVREGGYEVRIFTPV